MSVSLKFAQLSLASPSSPSAELPVTKAAPSGQQSGTLLGRKLSVIGEVIAAALGSFSLDVVNIVDEFCIGANKDLGILEQLHESSGMVPAELEETIQAWGQYICCQNLKLIKTVHSKFFSGGGIIYSKQAKSFVMPLTSYAIKIIIPHCPDLERLDIVCSKEAATLLSQFNLTKLCHLGLDIPYDTEFNSRDFEELARKLAHLNSLRSLTVERCSQDAIENLDQFPGITELTLFNLPRCRKDIEKLSQHRILSTLRLIGIDSGTMGYMMEDRCNIFTCLPSLLETLYLERCGVLPFITENFFIPPRLLQTLTFKDCNVSDSEKAKILENVHAISLRVKVEFL